MKLIKKNPDKAGNTVHPPVPLHIRVTAFMMDYILLYYGLLLVRSSFGELQQVLEQLLQVYMDPKTDQARFEIFVQQSGIHEKLFLLMLYFLSLLALPIAYFYVSETFFAGRTLGKATFSLRTSNEEGATPCTASQIFIRSLLKGLSFSIYPLGIASLLFLKFNKSKRCLHDLASRTTTTQANTQSDTLNRTLS
jgi:uncharacterized RDD family membrane protein YckC